MKLDRIVPPQAYLLSIVLMLALHFWLPLAIFASPSLSMVGLVPLLVGLGVVVYLGRMYQAHRTNINTFAEPTALFTEGLFRYTRNPIYFGLVVSLLGIVLLLGSLSPLVVWILFVVVVDRYYIAYEELKLRRAFGEHYDAYRERTPRWLKVWVFE